MEYHCVSKILVFTTLFSGFFPFPRLRTQSEWSPRVCFSKVPKLFERISGAIILFVPSNEGVSRHETLQLFWFLFPLKRMKRPALQNKQVVVLRMAFRARKVFGTFEKRAPGAKIRFRLYETFCGFFSPFVQLKPSLLSFQEDFFQNPWWNLGTPNWAEIRPVITT